MPRKKNETDAPDIASLRLAIAKVFGKALERSFECESLSASIKRATREYLSPQTLRRFFGLLDTDFAPSVNTLNVLSRYCGYFDWDDFLENGRADAFVPLSSKKEIQLYFDFFKISLQDEQDINYHNASRMVSSRILENKELLEGMLKPLAENPISQIYFYEKFPFVDGLCTGYKRGIKYYLENKSGTEAQVFGNSLLILGGFLLQNKRQVSAAIDKLHRYTINSYWHPFVIARYIGSQLLYHHLIDNPSGRNPLLQQVKEYNIVFKQVSNIRFWKFPYFQFMICDYLNLVREFQLAHEIMQSIKGIGGSDIQVEEGYFDVLCVISRTAAIFAGRPQREIDQWPVPDFEKIGVIFRKYYSIWNLLGELQQIPEGRKVKREQVSQKIQVLAAQTGFVYFNDFALIAL